MAGKRSRPSRIDTQQALRGLRIDPSITAAMLPSISFSPTIGITARRIDKLGMDIRSFHEPLKRSVQKVISPSLRQNFDSGGRPNPWEPLADDTPQIQERIFHRGPHPILVKSGLLRRTAGQLNIWTITRESAIIKDLPQKVWYGKLHQSGARGSSARVGKRSLREIVNAAKRGEAHKGREFKTIPARPFIMLQDRDIKDIGVVFDKWLGERINKAWPA